MDKIKKRDHDRRRVAACRSFPPPIHHLAIHAFVVKRITRGGKTLKVEYYVQNQNDYTLQNEVSSNGKFEELVLRRASSTASGETNRNISITIPDDIDFEVIKATTINGNINLKNCIGKNVISNTQSGNIVINGGQSSNTLDVKTDSGTASVSDFSANASGTNFSTNSGTITYQPKDKGKEAQIVLSGTGSSSGSGSLPEGGYGSGADSSAGGSYGSGAGQSN